VTIAPVQRVSKPFSGVTSCPIGSGDGWATPSSGNLIVLTINADQVCSTPAGYTAGPSVVDDNAVYLFWKISAGNETTPTITPGGTTTAVMTACEYSGVAASPADGSNTSSIVNTVGTTTTSTSVTTTAAADLIIAVAGLAYFLASVAAPSNPSWTNGFVNQITVDVGANTNNHANTFYAELAAGAAGSYSTSCSWTTGMLERQELLFAVQAAATVVSATPEPIVVTGPTTAPVSRPTILRNTLQDPPVLTTPEPIVVTSPAPRPVVNRGYLLRNTLADPPVLTTPEPLVVSTPFRALIPPGAAITRSSLVDVVIVTQATPQPIVVSQPARPVPGTPPIIGRNTLQDPPVLTTPAPLVASQPFRPAPVAPAAILRSSLIDLATPGPLVIAPPATKPWNTPPIILRSSLADPIVVTGVATPQPLVISTPVPRPWTYRPLILAGGQACECTTHRPSAGVTGRPNTGTVTRPNTGITQDPCC
jgi:hypothetical protein